MTELKQFKREEIAKTSENVTRIIIHDKVYNVTEFLNEHPGGEEVLFDQSGKDASEDWDDVGHSSDAQELMKKYLIGEIVKEERTNSKPRTGWVSGDTKKVEQPNGPPSAFYIVLGGIIAVLFSIWYLELGA